MSRVNYITHDALAHLFPADSMDHHAGLNTLRATTGLAWEIVPDAPYAVSIAGAGFRLTADLAKMAPGYEAGETEFLSREAVMDRVMQWRREMDAAEKQKGHSQFPHPDTKVRAEAVKHARTLIDQLREQHADVDDEGKPEPHGLTSLDPAWLRIVADEMERLALLVDNIMPTEVKEGER